MQTFVDELLASGAYADESEMVLHAMYLLRDAELDRWQKNEELRRELMVGVEQLEHGEGVDGEQVFERLRKRLGEPGEPSW